MIGRTNRPSIMRRIRIRIPPSVHIWLVKLISICRFNDRAKRHLAVVRVVGERRPCICKYLYEICTSYLMENQFGASNRSRTDNGVEAVVTSFTTVTITWCLRSSNCEEIFSRTLIALLVRFTFNFSIFSGPLADDKCLRCSIGVSRCKRFCPEAMLLIVLL